MSKTNINLCIIVFILILISLVYYSIKDSAINRDSNSAMNYTMNSLEVGLKNFYERNSYYPDSNDMNVSELRNSLLFNKLGGPFCELDKSVLKGENIIDQWGKPIIYIHNSNYKDSPLAVKNSTGLYCNNGTYQIRSFGENGIDDKGLKDDIQNFKL